MRRGRGSTDAPHVSLSRTGKGTSSTRAAGEVPQDCGFSRWGPRVELESRKRGAIPIRRTIGREFSGDRVLVNIISVVSEVVWIANPMIGESSLPHFGVSSANSAERVGVSALD